MRIYKRPNRTSSPGPTESSRSPPGCPDGRRRLQSLRLSCEGGRRSAFTTVRKKQPEGGCCPHLAHTAPDLFGSCERHGLYHARPKSSSHPSVANRCTNRSSSPHCTGLGRLAKQSGAIPATKVSPFIQPRTEIPAKPKLPQWIPATS